MEQYTVLMIDDDKVGVPEAPPCPVEKTFLLVIAAPAQAIIMLAAYFRPEPAFRLL